MMFAVLAGIALWYIMQRVHPNRWEMPGVLAPEDQFTPERLRDLCEPRPNWPRVYAPEECFAPGRYESLTKPKGFFDRSVCAPASAFAPERYEALMSLPPRDLRVYAPDGREFEAPYWTPGPRVYAPDGRDLEDEALAAASALMNKKEEPTPP